MKIMIPAVFALLFSAVASAQAAPCTLQKLTTLDMQLKDGHALVPVTVNGEAENLIVDTGGAFSMLSESAAHKLGLPLHPQMWSEFVMFGGIHSTKMAMASRISVGTLNAYRYYFAVLPDGALEDGVDGLLAPNILAANDIDFDFANRKFSIFSQTHCYGGVVYWTRDSFVSIPFHIDDIHHIETQLTLDGQAIDATVDTGAPYTTMSLETAERLYHIDPKSPDLKPVKDDDGKSVFGYSYPFKTLSLGGLTVNNPHVILVSDSKSTFLGGNAVPNVLLGFSILSKLHLYIAYGEKNLYITPADAH
ncbi:MAG TPA: aspartyl protease family protein [Rhizomicrobium sp.]